MANMWINSDSAAYPAMARIYDVHESIKDFANQGYYAITGVNVTASTTAGKLKVNTGQAFIGNTEVVFGTALDNINCASNADASNPRWGVVELSSPVTPGTVTAALNLGAAAANPVPPALTAGTVPLALVYIPANATAVDSLTSTNNGKCKIIDCRQLRVRQLANRSLGKANTFSANVTLTTTLGSILNTTNGLGPITVPAYSFKLGDIYQITASGLYTNDTNSAVQFQIPFGTNTVLNYTTPSLTSSANPRHWTISCILNIGSNGAFWLGMLQNSFMITAASSSSTTDVQMSTGGGTSGDWAIRAYQTTWGNNFGDQVIDLQARVVTTSTTPVITVRQFSVVKFPSP